MRHSCRTSPLQMTYMCRLQPCSKRHLLSIYNTVQSGCLPALYVNLFLMATANSSYMRVVSFHRFFFFMVVHFVHFKVEIKFMYVTQINYRLQTIRCLYFLRRKLLMPYSKVMTAVLTAVLLLSVRNWYHFFTKSNSGMEKCRTRI